MKICRHVMITGASRGIGAAMAERMLRNEMKVSMIARDEMSMRKIAAQFGRLANVIPADLSDPDALQDAVRKSEAFAPVDAAVFNAGMTAIGDPENMTHEMWRKVMSLNLDAPFLMSRQLIPLFRKRRGGHFVFISSVASETYFAGNLAYGVSKAGLNKLSEDLREALRPDGIAVTLMLPAATDTPLWDGSGINRDGFTRPEDLASALEYVLKSPRRAVPEILRIRRTEGDV